jgi:hypothetical protein
MKITTNHHRREVIHEYQLTAKEREEFDYLDWAAMERGEDSRSFIRYHGVLYDLSDTEPGPGSQGMPPSLKDWSCYRSDTYFSGVVFRWVQDDPPYSDDWLVICGSYYES